MKRIFIIILDSFGIGTADDANKFGDYGANTLGHIAEYCNLGRANFGRYGALKLPNLTYLGLAKAAEQSTGYFPIGLNKQIEIIGAYAYASSISSGKDTLSGHLEIVGVPILFDWGYFTKNINSFPKILLDKLISYASLPGYLGNCHSSGTAILDLLGEEHMHTNKPIFYTSIDSVFQIACHEKTFGLHKLYNLCKIARKILTDGQYNIGRVIARPFIGTKSGDFQRTDNRRDFAMEIPSITVLQKLIQEKNGVVVSIGKIADIYSNRGITKKVNATGISALFNATLCEIDKAEDKTIVFTNFIDFDSIYGHRRNVSGYAAALEYFDYRLPELITRIKENDMLIITADHGCDPTWCGTNHTREHVPVLIYNPQINPGFYGHRNSFADIGQTIAKFFNLSLMNYGKAII